MVYATPKRKNLTASEISRQKRKELLLELLPLAKSFGLWIVLVMIVAIDYTGHRWFSMFFINFTTYLTIVLAKLMFISAHITGAGMSMMTTLEVNYKSVEISNYPMIIELECSAYQAYLAMVSLIVFSSWKLKQKMIIGTIIFGILSIVNSLRIIIIGVVGQKFPQMFNTVHDYIWNILLVIIIWSLWEFTNHWLKRQLNEEIPSK